MTETPSNEARPAKQISTFKGTLVILLAIPILFILIVVLRPHDPVDAARRVHCMANLKTLGQELVLYASENGDQYPPAEQWCDVLARQHADETGESTDQFRQKLRCPVVDEGAWGYAMNPQARPTSDPNVVLLFESDAGWKGFGGADQLVTGRHGDEGCCVHFVDGRTEYIKAEGLAALEWGDNGASLPEPNSALPPADNEE